MVIHPLVICHIAIEHMAIEIVDLPIEITIYSGQNLLNNDDSYVNVYQRVAGESSGNLLVNGEVRIIVLHICSNHG